MGYELVSEVIRRYPGPAKLTLIILADFADDSGRNIFPSQATIASRAGKDARQVRRDLERLIEGGLVVKVRAGGVSGSGRFTSNAYAIDRDAVEALPLLGSVGHQRPTDSSVPRSAESASVGHECPLSVGHERPTNKPSEATSEATRGRVLTIEDVDQ